MTATIHWSWHDNEPAAIAGTTMTAEYKPNQIWVLNRSETDRKEVWSWTKQGSSGNQGSNKQWRQQHIDPNCGNWGSQHSSGNQGDLMGNLLSTLSSPPGCPPPLSRFETSSCPLEPPHHSQPTPSQSQSSPPPCWCCICSLAQTPLPLYSGHQYSEYIVFLTIVFLNFSTNLTHGAITEFAKSPVA